MTKREVAPEDWADAGNGWQQASITLAEGESMNALWSVVCGPATVTIWEAPSGSLTYEVDKAEA